MVALADMARSGVRLDDDTISRLAGEEARNSRWGRIALWIGALSLLGIAWQFLFAR